VRGGFTARDNRAPAISTRALMDDPAAFDYSRLAHPPVTFRHEKLKSDERIPAARRYIVEQKLNELMHRQACNDLGMIVQGGLYNALDPQPAAARPGRCLWRKCHPCLLVLNVARGPLVPDQVAGFLRQASAAVLVLEEGQPEYIEQEIATLLAPA
jgi:indolepyruvate ferredoxin oxidoreductase alpha subunit